MNVLERGLAKAVMKDSRMTDVVFEGVLQCVREIQVHRTDEDFCLRKGPTKVVVSAQPSDNLAQHECDIEGLMRHKFHSLLSINGHGPHLCM